MDKAEILKKAEILMRMHREGLLGGEIMPEDNNPGLPKWSKENYLYFTLPMALNYQRNSYTLWESALKTYSNENINFVFTPETVINKSFDDVQSALIKYKLALQRNKQTQIWIKLCNTIIALFDGDIRSLFIECDNDVKRIKEFIQIKFKKDFPYLSGIKICNYWLYVMTQYTDIKFKNIEYLTVAPDTHVVKATYRLGLIDNIELTGANVQKIVTARWNDLFKDTGYIPIDIHTALWLWSRNGFTELEGD